MLTNTSTSLWSVITALNVHVAGQFWNIPISVGETNDQSYVQIYEPGHESYRNFPAFFYDLVWDHSDDGCYYAEDSQGGPERSRDLTHSVIKGDYTQYVMDGLFDTGFTYNRFDDANC